MGKMLKRRYANSAEGDFRLKHLNDEFFSGYVCFNKLKSHKPVICNAGGKEICVRDNDYVWILVYPEKSNYAITIVFDDKLNLVEWYFDIAKLVGVENGIPFEDDLFLDMVILPDGQVLTVDEDELLDAKEKGIIGDKDVKLAYSTLELVKNKYGNNFEDLKVFTKYLCGQFNMIVNL